MRERVLEEAVACRHAIGRVGVDGGLHQMCDPAGIRRRAFHQVHQVSGEDIARVLHGRQSPEGVEIGLHVGRLGEAGEFRGAGQAKRGLNAAAGVGGVRVGDALRDQRFDRTLPARSAGRWRVVDEDVDHLAGSRLDSLRGRTRGRRVGAWQGDGRQFRRESTGIELIDDDDAIPCAQSVEAVDGLDAARQDVALPGQRHGAGGIAGDPADPRLMAEVVGLVALEGGR
jgi:hypothetical protein